MFNHTHTHTHTHIYIYIYIYCSHLFIFLPQINIQICQCTQTVRMSLLKDTKEVFKTSQKPGLKKPFEIFHYATLQIRSD